uniref:Phospholipase D family member 5 n=1 Tax=Ursus maritimus TaxID=29073 RepID=A0A452U5K8_URSMA
GAWDQAEVWLTVESDTRHPVTVPAADFVPATQECFWFRAPAEGDFLLKKKKNQSYNQVSFGISVDTKRTVECAAILIRILCGTFCLYHDKVFSLTFSRIALVENIPEGLNYSENAPFHLSLFQGWMNLLSMARKSVDIVSSHWDLNHSHPSACQGQRLFEKLLQLTSQNIEIKLVSDVTADSKERR